MDRNVEKMHAGRIINNSYNELGVALDKLGKKKHKNIVKRVRKQLLRILDYK